MMYERWRVSVGMTMPAYAHAACDPLTEREEGECVYFRTATVVRL